MNGNYFLARAEHNRVHKHEKFSARLGGIPACQDRAGTSARLSGLKLFHVIVITF